SSNLSPKPPTWCGVKGLMQTRTIDTSRLRTHCWVAGPDDGEPLLLVHGNLTTGRFFRALAEALPPRFRIVAPDLRSFGGTAALDFVRRLAARDASEAEPQSSPRVIVRSFFWSPRYKAPDEDELIAEVLLTHVGEEFYPGASTPSGNWPGVGPAPRGVNNALSPAWCNTSAFGEVQHPAPLLWIRGDEDAVVSDASMFDFGTLGRLGAVPGWPGENVFPSQPMIAQTRRVLTQRQGRGGRVREIVLPGVAHGPLIERPAEVANLIREHIEAAT